MASSSYRVYVTFSGESSKALDAPSPTDAKPKTKPINTIKALSPKGNEKGDVLPKDGTYSELRGMALDAQGQLYVANAHKSGSAIDVFGPPQSDGTRPLLVSGLITETSSSAFWHPYQLTFEGTTLFVSSQDTNVVSAYTVSGSGSTTSATPVATCAYLSATFSGPFYDGTWIASSVAVAHGGVTPEAVSAAQGGLGMTTEPARHSVRGIALAGTQLFVSDEAGQRVGLYDVTSGAMQGTLISIPEGALPNTIENPVGLAVNSQSGAVAIGSTGNDVIFLYDPASAALCVLYDAGANGYTQLSGLAWSPDGTTLYFGSRKKRRVYALDVSTGKATKFSPKFDDSPECLLVVAS
jgi:sugar lactone lactonase YvrE